jgi:xanthine dehydrogenase accessory factor
MNQEILQALIASEEAREAVALISVTSATGIYEGTMGQHALIWLNSDREPIGDLSLGELNEPIYDDARRILLDREHQHTTYSRPDGEVKVFVEVQVQPPHLIIVGAGHIAVPLASIAATCDFSVTVLDDRPQYAHVARFPTAKQVIAGPFREELAALRGPSGFDKHTYIVLVTRGHQHDIDCLVEVLDDPLAYIGMIGSQRRIRAVFELLERERGIAPEKFDRIFAPVGLDIAARTPAEIAVCIMAEIINTMRQGPAIPMSEQIRQERQARRNRVATAHS